MEATCFSTRNREGTESSNGISGFRRHHGRNVADPEPHAFVEETEEERFRLEASLARNAAGKQISPSIML